MPLWLIRFLPYILCSLAVGGAFLYADEGWHNAVAKRAEAKLTAYEVAAAKEELRKKEAFLRLEQDADAAAKKKKDKTNADFAALQTGPMPGGDVRVPGVAGVLNAGAAIVNSAGDAPKPAGAAPPVSTGTDTTVQALRDWGIEAERVDKLCRDRVADITKWYDLVRSTK